MNRGYARDNAGRIADVLAQANVWPEFGKFKKILGKMVHEPGEAHDLWVRMSEPKLGKEMAHKLANLMTHFGWAPQQKITPERPFFEQQQDLSIADLTRPGTIMVHDAGWSTDGVSLGTVEKLGAGRIFRSKPGHVGTGFGFEYFTQTQDGMPIRATLKAGDRIINPGDIFYDPK